MNNNPDILSILPNDFELEQIVLGQLLVKPELIAESKYNEIDMSPNDFYYESHQLIYRSMLSIESDDDFDFDILGISENLRADNLLERVGGREYINNIALLAVSTQNFNFYAKKIKDLAIRRNIITHGQALINSSATPGTKLEEIYNSIINMPNSVIPEQKEGKRTWKDMVNDFRLTLGTDMTIGRPKTGATKLDNMLGCFFSQQLYYIAARPSVGKSSFMLWMLYNMITQQDMNVILFSLEMSEREIMAKKLARETRIDSQKIFLGKATSEAEIKKLAESLDRLDRYDQKLILDTDTDTTPGKVISVLKKNKKDGIKTDIVFIDHIHIMIDDKEHINQNELLAETSRRLKNIAKAFDIPIVVCVQLNRNNESRNNKVPCMADLRGSGSLEQNANVIMFLHSDAYNERNDLEKTDNQGNVEDIKVLIEKNRNGPTGIADFSFVKQLCQFIENNEKQNG
jgi:replicative DNA helicase